MASTVCTSLSLSSSSLVADPVLSPQTVRLTTLATSLDSEPPSERRVSSSLSSVPSRCTSRSATPRSTLDPGSSRDELASSTRYKLVLASSQWEYVLGFSCRCTVGKILQNLEPCTSSGSRERERSRERKNLGERRRLKRDREWRVGSTVAKIA
jgi:hypothetical protein